MKEFFLKRIFLFFAFFVFSACEDLSFTDEDIFQPEIKKEIAKETAIPETKNQTSNKETSNISEDSKQISEEEITVLSEYSKQISEEEITVLSEDSKQISEEEITILSEDLELSENTIIQNKKVILDMMTIKTLQHDLTIIAEEFISNHSIIKNFPEEQTAKKKENGKHGGNVLIEAETASGNLKLILKGENGGLVPVRRSLSKKERLKLKGKAGGNGRDAIYREFCNTETFIILSNTHCWEECILPPTRGERGGNGLQGFPGWNGKSGGNSGSFHLKAINLSDFYLTDIKKTPGLGSPGGKGSSGGYGGKRGKNGRDTENLCSSHLPRPKKGRKGNRGKYGKNGEKGREEEVCLESLKNQNQQAKENTEKEKASSAINKNQSEENKTEMVCKKDESGIMCREVLLENKSAEILDNKKQKENVVCY